MVVTSDFDNTMVQKNTAEELVLWYVRHSSSASFPVRLWRFARIANATLRRKNLQNYYACLREITPEQQREVLCKIPLNERWLAQLDTLRKTKGTPVKVTLISRNCVDVVRVWLACHAQQLRDAKVQVTTIIANQPLSDLDVSFVREKGTFRHVNYVGFGQMGEDEKRAFIDHATIYLGDREEESLRPLVRTFLRV